MVCGTSVVKIKSPVIRKGLFASCYPRTYETHTIKRFDIKDVSASQVHTGCCGCDVKNQLAFATGGGNTRKKVQMFFFTSTEEPDMDRIMDYVFGSLDKVAEEVQEQRMLNDTGITSNALQEVHNINANVVDTSRGAEYQPPTEARYEAPVQPHVQPPPPPLAVNTRVYQPAPPPPPVMIRPPPPPPRARGF